MSFSKVEGKIGTFQTSLEKHPTLAAIGSFGKRNGWKLFAVVGLAIFIFSSARTLRFPNAYALSHWLYSYDFGFIKRGFIGHLVQPLLNGKKPNEIVEVVHWLSALIFCGFFVAMFWPIRNLPKDIHGIPKLLFLQACFVTYSSAFVVFMAHITGYFDQLLAAFALVSILEIQKDRFFVPAALTVVGLLIHEIYALCGFPAVVFAVFMRALTPANTERTKLWATLARKLAYVVIPAICVFALIFWSQERLSPSAISSIEQEITEYGVLNKTEVWWGMYHFTHKMSSNWRSERIKARERITRQNVAKSVVPSVVFLLLASALFLQGTGKLYLLALLVPVVFSPLIIHFFASDTLRFSSFMIFNAFASLVAIATMGSQKKFIRWQFISLATLSLIVLWMNFTTKHTLMDRQVDGQGVFSIHPRAK